jgi:hypothetical protein
MRFEQQLQRIPHRLVIIDDKNGLAAHIPNDACLIRKKQNPSKAKEIPFFGGAWPYLAGRPLPTRSKPYHGEGWIL